MWLQIGKFDKPALIKRGDTKIPLTLKFNLNETGMEFEAKLYLHTNASTFVIPIYVYNGRLQVRLLQKSCTCSNLQGCTVLFVSMQVVLHRPELFRGQLDFGTLAMGTHQSMLFTLRNNNPLNVSSHSHFDAVPASVFVSQAANSFSGIHSQSSSGLQAEQGISVRRGGGQPHDAAQRPAAAAGAVQRHCEWH